MSTALITKTYLSVFLEIDFEGFYIIVKAERWHGKEDVFSVDGLAFFLVAPLAGLTGDEADELGHTLLDAFLGVLGNLQPCHRSGGWFNNLIRCITLRSCKMSNHKIVS